MNVWALVSSQRPLGQPPLALSNTNDKGGRKATDVRKRELVEAAGRARHHIYLVPLASPEMELSSKFKVKVRILLLLRNLVQSDTLF